MMVTFGSGPRNAERRNLKAPVPTRRSVQARIADFCSFWASRRSAAPRVLQRPCRRPRSTVGFTLMTMSTSGTATPKAVPPLRLPLAKPTTSASGIAGATMRCTARAMRSTSASPSGVGAMRRRSSLTSASQPSTSKVGACTGMALGFRTSAFGASAAAPGPLRGAGGRVPLRCATTAPPAVERSAGPPVRRAACARTFQGWSGLAAGALVERGSCSMPGRRVWRSM
mmetsp:Transcript_49495/g.152739  ORF Transcript_49495/g.152739 Transcript_49495/m.152739 type:complete len:227 (+) Transcript_49495:820-1500(+)